MSTDTGEAKAEQDRVLMVYLGTSRSYSKKPPDRLDTWYMVEGQGKDTSPRDEPLPPWDKLDSERVFNFDKVRPNSCRPGDLYSFPCEVKGNGSLSIYGRWARYEGQWSVKEQRLEWEARHRAEEAWVESDRMARRDARKNDAFKEAMLPLRRVFHKLPYSKRTGFVAAVLHELERDLGRDEVDRQDDD